MRPYEFQPEKSDLEEEDDTADQQPPPPSSTQAPQQYNIVQPRPEAGQGGNFQSDESVCGVPVAGFTQSLVIGGQAAGHGEWWEIDWECVYDDDVIQRMWNSFLIVLGHGWLHFIAAKLEISSLFVVDRLLLANLFWL